MSRMIQVALFIIIFNMSLTILNSPTFNVFGSDIGVQEDTTITPTSFSTTTPQNQSNSVIGNVINSIPFLSDVIEATSFVTGSLSAGLGFFGNIAASVLFTGVFLQNFGVPVVIANAVNVIIGFIYAVAIIQLVTGRQFKGFE